MQLADLIKPYRSISIVGMCKNAGKTTVLNYLIAKDAVSTCLGITSVGRDGETADVLTGTPKPQIFLSEGMIAATAASLLRHSTCTREILAATGIGTPLGDIVIFRAISAGYAEIAGPSVSEQTADIKGQMFGFGAGRILIDGALGRKSPGAPYVADAVILASGASLNKDMYSVVDETAFFCSLYSLKRTGLSDVIEAHAGKSIFPDIGLVSDPADIPGALSDKKITTVYFSGALTDRGVEAILKSGRKPAGLTVIVYDASRILASAQMIRRFLSAGGKLEVIRPGNLLAVTVNPVSAYGYSFDAGSFKRAVEEASGFPVYDVMEGQI